MTRTAPQLLTAALILALTLAATLLPAPATAGLQDGLIAHWPLNGDAQDQGPFSLHGYLTGATPCPDLGQAPGQALLFHGGQDVIEAPDNELFTPQALSITAWIQPQTSSQWARILDKYSHTDQNGFALALNRSLYPFFQFWNQAGEEFGVQGTTPLVMGQWRFVAVTWDGQTLRLYQDGNLEDQKTAPGPIRPAAKPLTLGNGNDGYNPWPYTGAMDEVRFYSRALDPAEIHALAALSAADQPLPPANTPPPGCPCPDSDHDGVPDPWDACPGTLPTALTNAQGCSP